MTEPHAAQPFAVMAVNRLICRTRLLAQRQRAACANEHERRFATKCPCGCPAHSMSMGVGTARNRAKRRFRGVPTSP